MESLTYRLPGLLPSDDTGLLESSSSSFDVAIEPVVVCASPPVGDSVVSVFGLNSVIGWPCALWWWWWWCWWVLALLPPLMLPLIIVAVGHDVNVLVAVNCVSVMGSIWKHPIFEAKKRCAWIEGARKRVEEREQKRNIKLSAWSEKINNATTRNSWKNSRVKSQQQQPNNNDENSKRLHSTFAIGSSEIFLFFIRSIFWLLMRTQHDIT